MKQVISYACELCGAIFNTEKEAIECERSHQKCESIVHAEYFSSHKPYPMNITVKFENGETVGYTWSKYT